MQASQVAAAARWISTQRGAGPVSLFAIVPRTAAYYNPKFAQQRFNEVVNTLKSISTPDSESDTNHDATVTEPSSCGSEGTKSKCKNEATDSRIDAKSLFGVLGALAAGGFLVVASGYVISSFTVTVGIIVTWIVRGLRKSGLESERAKIVEAKNYAKGDEEYVLANNFHWECCISARERKKLIEALGLNHIGCEQESFTAEQICVAYHHGILKHELQDHLGRRWDYFLIGMNCLTAFVLACLTLLFFGYLCTADPVNTFVWLIVALIVLAAMLFNSASAWIFVGMIRRMCLNSTTLVMEREETDTASPKAKSPVVSPSDKALDASPRPDAPAAASEIPVEAMDADDPNKSATGGISDKD